MIKIYTLFLLFTTSVLQLYAEGDSNILTNTSFEMNLDGWLSGTWGGGAGTFTVSSEYANDGASSAKCEVTTATPDSPEKVYMRYNNLNIVEDAEYTLTFYTLSASGDEESINVSMYSNGYTGDATALWGEVFSQSNVTYQGDGAWHKHTYVFTASSIQGTPLYTAMGLSFSFAKKAGIFFIDNVELKTSNTPSVEPEPVGSVHVSKQGNDDADGSLETPFLTLARAAAIVQAGDTVYIHEGTYEETLTPSNSGTLDNPIVFQAYNNDQVIISAMQAIDGWQLDQGDIYKTTIDWDLGESNFVMHGSTALDLARWPNNVDGDPFTLDSKRNSGGSGAGDLDAFLTSTEIPNYDWSKGGSIFFYGDLPGSGWTAWKSWITKSSSGRVDFSLNKNPSWIRTFHYPSGKGDFYLEGIKEALDYENEWFFDESDKTLYVQLENGDKPEDFEVSMRRRILTIDLGIQNYIEINNLAVFGGGIEIKGDGNKLHAVSSFYGNWTRGIVEGFKSENQSILVVGKNNVIDKCEIAFGAGSGVFATGNNTEVLNSNIHDFNFLGCYDAPMMVRDGEGMLIKSNKIYRGGRDAIQIISKNSEVAYNDISQSNMIADDCALLYTLGAGLNMTIHHNWFHDAAGRGELHKAAGIYLDNDAGNVDVHHNVVTNVEWSCVQINWNGTNINVYNNTLWNGSGAMGAWHKDGTAFTNVNVWNNLTNMDSLEPQSDKKNNLIMSSDANPFTNMDAMDYTLVNGAAAIDYGQIIDGITDGYVGSAPDVGAYESGKTPWDAGITWNANFGPNGNGCYGLPGNYCFSDSDGDGVADELDECPNTPSGSSVNENGCIATAVEDSPISGSIEIFPNPAVNENVWVTLPSHFKGSAIVRIIDVTGRCVLSQKTFNNQTEMNLDSISKGIYIISVDLGSERYTEKMIKQ